MWVWNLGLFMVDRFAFCDEVRVWKTVCDGLSVWENMGFEKSGIQAHLYLRESF
ncbi:hypothetical protein M758_10G114100 [Ceratodon purpureus]|uniref:Uncharacterized protein n=1 Tax=Ceratodon purpureus TaxID=3225 RepID=A0A8T0GRL1_CERPU|nr:hypothetical protein KC19_10G117600 [Ceratodon purpureus]KAG0603697.1 hypothetical protein M758_10G114100 [Ceratodon purpureus]